MTLTELDDVDDVLAELVLAEESLEPFQNGEAVAVRAILDLSRAGADLMTMASHANRRDVERLSKAARAQLDQARSLMVGLVNIRTDRRRGPAECLGRDMDCGRPLPCPDHSAVIDQDAQACPTCTSPDRSVRLALSWSGGHVCGNDWHRP